MDLVVIFHGRCDRDAAAIDRHDVDNTGIRLRTHGNRGVRECITLHVDGHLRVATVGTCIRLFNAQRRTPGGSNPEVDRGDRRGTVACLDGKPLPTGWVEVAGTYGVTSATRETRRHKQPDSRQGDSKSGHLAASSDGTLMLDTTTANTSPKQPSLHGSSISRIACRSSVRS